MTNINIRIITSINIFKFIKIEKEKISSLRLNEKQNYYIDD